VFADEFSVGVLPYRFCVSLYGSVFSMGLSMVSVSVGSSLWVSLWECSLLLCSVGFAVCVFDLLGLSLVLCMWVA
jgi:hypothetical protein